MHEHARRARTTKALLWGFVSSKDRLWNAGFRGAEIASGIFRSYSQAFPRP
jgi:hypothetical protein